MKKIIALILSLAVFASINIVAFAEVSPEGEKKYNVTITTPDGEETKTQIVKDGDHVILVATDEDGYTFEEWEITGDYEIIEGDEESERLVIKPLSDLEIKEIGSYDEDKDVSDEKPQKPGKPNDSEASPPTGTFHLFWVLGGLFLLFLCVAVISKKRVQ